MARSPVFSLTVPGTDEPLHEDGPRLLSADHTRAFTRLDHGIWDLTRAERRPLLDAFALRYAAVRAAEGRELSPEAIRRLPDIDAENPLADQWRQRASSYRKLTSALSADEAGSVVDVGSGSGWLASRFADRGWAAAAIDVTVDGGDGLAAARHHHGGLFLARAEMEAMPFASNTVDLVVFNASLHYARDIAAVLAEARRVARSTGTIAVLDSPVYKDPDAGRRSVAEFAARVRDTFGLEAAPLEGSGFVTEADLDAFARSTGRTWTRSGIDRGPRGRFRRRLGARHAGREIASRPLLIARGRERR